MIWLFLLGQLYTSPGNPFWEQQINRYSNHPPLWVIPDNINEATRYYQPAGPNTYFEHKLGQDYTEPMIPKLHNNWSNR